MRLGMSLIVRDECDIVAHNILFHARHGVDTFAILDNGSLDGTFELLESLRQSYEIALFRDVDGFRKEERSMFLADHLRHGLGVSHLISNDADEFWVPRSDSLKSLVAAHSPVKYVPRYNFIVQRKEVERLDYEFFDSTFLVIRPPAFQPPSPDPNTPLVVPMALRAVPGKVFCAIEGLRRIFKGNHSVMHDAGAVAETTEAVVLHYPVRSYEQFARKIRNHAENLVGISGAESWHLRRWHAIQRAGRLRAEYDTLVFGETAVQALLAAGTIREEKILAEFFRTHGPRANCDRVGCQQ